MISRGYRFFQDRRALRYLFSRGRYLSLARDLPVRVRVVANSRNHWRLAVIVSKKVNKRAVVRNRIRRRLYHLAKQELALEPLDIAIIVIKDDLAGLPADQLRTLTRPVWDQIRQYQSQTKVSPGRPR